MDSGVTEEYGGPDDPHVRFWNEWNREWRFRGDLDEFMERQRDIATTVAQDACLKNARILDVGCGTGWLASALLPFGKAWGTDLSPQAIEDGRRRHPDVQLLCGDFLELDLEGPFQLVVSSDSLVPMPDYAACVARIASLQTTGDTFLLMTQNPFVWRRRSTLRPHHPSVPHGPVEGVANAAPGQAAVKSDPGSRMFARSRQGEIGVCCSGSRIAMSTGCGRYRRCAALEVVAREGTAGT